MRKTLLMISVVFSVLISACTTSPIAQSTTTVTTRTADGISIFGETYFEQLGPGDPLILLFHQGGSNGRGEYSPIVSALNRRGYRAIAWDLRSGGGTYGAENRTVENLPEHANTSYCDARADLQAALDFVIDDEIADTVIAWGSSYSAALVFELASNNPDHVSGVIAFSPAAGGPLRGPKWRGLLQRNKKAS